MLARSDETLQVSVEGYDRAIFLSVYRPAPPEMLDVLLGLVDGQKGGVLYHIGGQLKVHGMKLAEIQSVRAVDLARTALSI